MNKFYAWEKEYSQKEKSEEKRHENKEVKEGNTRLEAYFERINGVTDAVSGVFAVII